MYTSDLKGKSLEGTGAKVYLSLMDDKNETERIWLNNYATKKGRELFETGHMDEFSIHTNIAMSRPKKIRIGHDNSGFGPGWYLNKVVLKHKQTGQSFTFNCDRWLAKNEDDGRIERVLSSMSNRQENSNATRSESARSVNSVASSKNSKASSKPPLHVSARSRRDSDSDEDKNSFGKKKQTSSSNRKSSSVSSDEKFDKLFNGVQSPIKDMRGSSRNSDLESKSQDSSFNQLLLSKEKNKYDVKKEPSFFSISDDDSNSAKKRNYYF